MEELVEDIAYTGDPVPKPKLADADRAKLDSIVAKMIANKESDSDIQFVVDDFKAKYIKLETVKQQAQSQPSSKFKPMSDWLNIPQQGYQPMDQDNVVPIDDHTRNTAQAAERVRTEVGEIDTHVRNLIYDKKKDLTGRIKSQELGINPRESAPLNPQAAQMESQL